jgi:cytochrome c peroxidase
MRILASILFLSLTTSILAQAPPPPPPPPPPAPQPLGPPPSPPGNDVTEAKANLGKALFWDEQLSSPRTIACGTCHQSPAGGSDPRSAPEDMRSTHPGLDGIFATDDDVTGSPGVPLSGEDGTYQWETSFGIRPQVTGRRGMSAINAAYAPELFWDGRAGGEFRDPISDDVVLTTGAALESQVLGPPLSTAEMGHIGRNWNDVATRVASSKPLALSPNVPSALEAWIDGRDYPALFAEAFGSEAVTPARIAMAIATYERTLWSGQTPFDAFNGGNPAALTQQERRGEQVFRQVGCARCHGGPLLTDQQFHNTGVRPAAEDQGRFSVTGRNGDRGAFRTPTLRNVELRAPYFHNGRSATLESAIDFYDRGGDADAPNKDDRIVPLGLTPQQKADLAAFLRRPLTDPRVAAGTAPFDRPALYSESDRVPEITGVGIAGAGGNPPAVLALEPPVAGNASFTVGVRGGAAGMEAVLVIDGVDPGTGPAIPAGGSFARRAIRLGNDGAGGGYGSASFAIPDSDAALIGATFYGRWYIAGAGAGGGVAVSPAFRMTVFGEATGKNGVGREWEIVR